MYDAGVTYENAIKIDLLREFHSSYTSVFEHNEDKTAYLYIGVDSAKLITSREADRTIFSLWDGLGRGNTGQKQVPRVGVVKGA